MPRRRPCCSFALTRRAGAVLALALVALAARPVDAQTGDASKPAELSAPGDLGKPVEPTEAVANWLGRLGVSLVDAQGLRGPATPKLAAEAVSVNFARVPRARIKPADLSQLKDMPRLAEVVLGGGAGTDDVVAELARSLPKLKRLFLSSTRISDAALAHVAKFRELDTLDLGGTAVTAAGMAQLAGLRNLRMLRLDDTAIGDAGLDALKPLPVLRDVSFGGMAGVDKRGVAALAALKRLEILNLPGAEIDAAVEELAASRTLWNLNLYGATITDAGAAHLGAIKNLRALQLSQTAITDKAMPAIASLAHLASLEIVETRIGDAGIAALAGHKTLQELDLTNTPITDAALEILGGLPKLAKLFLRGTKVTDAGLAKLAGAKALVELDVSDTPVTVAGVAALKAALPKLLVIGRD